MRKSRETINSNDFYVYELCLTYKTLYHIVTRMIRWVCPRWLATLTRKKNISIVSISRFLGCLIKFYVISEDLCLAKSQEEKVKKRNMLASFILTYLFWLCLCTQAMCCRSASKWILSSAFWNTVLVLFSLYASLRYKNTTSLCYSEYMNKSIGIHH